MKITNPATEEIITEIPENAVKEIQNKYQKAKTALESWSENSLVNRIACLREFSSLLEINRKPLAEILTSEMGKPITQSQGEIKGARVRIKYFLENSFKWLSEEWISKLAGVTERIRYEPLGVIGNISAWNYPYLVGVNVFVPALIGGNAVLYKPSEFATLTGLEIQKLLERAGLYSDVFQVITGGANAGEAMLKLPLDGYFFTGSYKTGKHIYDKVSQKMAPCQLELGGKDPMYVTNDFTAKNLPVSAGVEGAFYNNGQSCCAVERIYVHEEIYEEYVAEFIKQIEALKIGNPTDNGVFIGPLARKEQLVFLKEQIEDAQKKGARLLIGGSKIDRKGYFFEPTVLTDVNHEMSVMKAESFGPVIGIQKVSSDAEAIDLMNDTEFGLTASVYSKSWERAEKILNKMDSGSVYWNCCDRVSASLPWSGRKNSGIGSTLSYHGIRAFVKPKAYHLNEFV